MFIAALGAAASVPLILDAHAASHGKAVLQRESETSRMPGPDMMGRGLLTPTMNAARGRQLFASKGCVVCHSINGVGGQDATALDASSMRPVMNPFEFTARMWRGAEAMIILQREELGEQIEFTGDELADIIAFTHDLQEQQRFSEDDIPQEIRALMDHSESEDEDKHGDDEKPKDRH